ncbi:MAG TPA: type Z 30S ribosomal protein S14 [Candidatus Pacebacteria bacterium]|nr:MAG: 30S ribosomal protein S14 [Candidatus Pacebacteria bacterium RIFCSPHIGHO2_01_FULL_46_10]HAV15288.1 type Z 30S ribosomal protein S14 [Candidatus Paceibacterota bacterium]HCR11004.1 type Z 30S ribosomal protein S14 [Candidatus Paceibacterota bacterium]HCR92436.1 type Z 30S ribosomal protein S14 [Candidatus Paceibacterota bacterium]
MAKISKINKTNKQNKSGKFSTRKMHRCSLCGRPRAYIRLFGVCRLCFRELVAKGELPGVTKASF